MLKGGPRPRTKVSKNEAKNTIEEKVAPQAPTKFAIKNSSCVAAAIFSLTKIFIIERRHRPRCSEKKICRNRNTTDARAGETRQSKTTIF